MRLLCNFHEGFGGAGFGVGGFILHPQIIIYILFGISRNDPNEVYKMQRSRGTSQC